jgi:hypothetical protein
MVKTAGKMMKQVAPGLHSQLVRFYFSEPIQVVRSYRTGQTSSRLIEQNRPVFAVDVDSPCGMGAVMSWVVGVLAYAEASHLAPRIRVTNPNYAVTAGEDWLGEYFERLAPVQEASDKIPLGADRYVKTSIHLLRKIWSSYSALPIQRIHDLFFGSFTFRQELTQEADSFCRRNDIGEETIGIHYRGTDKRSEATRIPWQQMAATIAGAMRPSTRNIFVASDEPAFIHFVKQEFSSVEVLDLGCREIYSDTPPHLTPGDPQLKAKEAIHTMLVLARCGLLIRTRSQLSAWSKIYNPALPTISLGELLVSKRFVFPENIVGG